MKKIKKIMVSLDDVDDAMIEGIVDELLGEEEKSKKKLPRVSTMMSKSALLVNIAESAGATRKQAAAALDQIAVLIEQHLKNKKIGKFVLPGLLKIEVKRKPATKARKGINPFTGAPTVFKAKPARNVVRIRPLKRLKDVVA